jgi:hypothetical protein
VDTCPDFAEAARRLRGFLSRQGWPEQIMWLRQGDVSRRSGELIVIKTRGQRDGEHDCQRAYERGRTRGLGVALEAVCTLGDRSCVIVSCPTDEREAELLMYPADGGLKLSAALPRIEGIVGG